MCSDIAIKVENLSKCYHIYDKPSDRLMQMLLRGQKQYYREFWATKDVSFEIKKGETVGIVGRNGSGKSTILQMICGTLNQTSGTIQTNGRIAALLELGSGFNPEFTGRENVYLNAAVLGLEKGEIDSRIDDILSFAEIGQFIDQPTKTYSSGMLVRLAFSVQAMVDPEILIVDEALAVGDEKFQRKCFSRLEELKSRGTSILFVSHSGPQVIELCERAILLDHGCLIMDSTPLEVVRSYQRIIYAPKTEQALLINSLKDKSLPPPSEPILDTEPEDALTSNEKSYFDKDLTPETTTIYPEQGAKIEKINIEDSQGNIVNILEPMQTYRIRMQGTVTADLTNISFGTHIRSVTGAVITGQRHPSEGKSLDSLKAGSSFDIEFIFNINLLPGCYFVGGGIWGNNSQLCAHRIMDALMFRVQNTAAQISFGYCDLSAAPAILKIGE